MGIAAEKTKRLYWLWLAESGLRGRRATLFRQYGTIEGVYRAYVLEREAAGEGLWRPGIEELCERLGDYERKGIFFCCCEEENYPACLKEIYSPPGGLYYQGHLPGSADGRTSLEWEKKEKDGTDKEIGRMAVVGARACSERGRGIARRIGRELAQGGAGVVSGLALGIDGAALAGAIEGEGRAYGVLGCGVDICYPKENYHLFGQVLERGGILSEYPPGTPPLPAYFPQRNRIISGLSDGVVVIEARKRSGSLITAEFGLEQGRNIYAVPGRPEDVLSEGCHYLIQNGAKLVTGAADILSDYEFSPGLRLDSGQVPKILLETTEKIVYACLRLEPKHLSQIQQESGLEWQEVFNILLKLELKGCARQVSMDCYVAL